MARRSSYTTVTRIGFSRPDHVKGMGDRAFRVLQCLNPVCTEILVIDERDLEGDFCVDCPSCSFSLKMGEVLELYKYQVANRLTGETSPDEPAMVVHEDYVMRAARFKYCIVCGALKPLAEFDRHTARLTGRQGECNMCKQDYNSVKNATRTTEQHRIASQQRRLYVQFDSPQRLDINAIVERFDGRCFKCGKAVAIDDNDGESLKANLDHTRPVYYLWPLTTDNATLLCREHNGNKRHKWPGDFYSDVECRKLAGLTGIDYRDLIGKPVFNPDAIRRLRDGQFVEELFQKFARYPDDLLRLRNRIMDAEGFDFLSSAPRLSPDWKKRADDLRD